MAEYDFIKDFTAADSEPKQLLRQLETLEYIYVELNKQDKNRIRQLTSAAADKAKDEKAKDDKSKDEKAKDDKSKDDKPKDDKAKDEKDKEKENNKEKEKQLNEAAISEIQARIKKREEEEKEEKMKIIDALRPTWEALSELLTALEEQPNSRHVIIAMQDVVQSFFLCYSMVIPPAPAEPQPSPIAEPQPSTATAEEMDKYQKEMFAFAEKHRFILNHILRGNSHALESSAFAILTHFPKLLDFDVKRKYFYKELKKLDSHDRNRYEDIAVRVRRDHIFGDSFRELHRLRPADWKARFYIMFENEEGQDAGGLLREWYQVITREIFNPNYALFINAPGDRVTYMINKSSNINPEHLEYFKFVGRLIAKAIRDNKQLDCYFTRAFYKHILNIHVRYQDIESEDMDIFKSLEFLLSNSVEEVGSELMFSVEVEEFGVRETRELKEGGHTILVTDANKKEYVHLMCQMKMTGSIRQQLNAFLEGFYELIPRKLISIFNEQELELLISGLPEIDIDDLCANTEYRNYTRTSQQIQWFWQALRSFEQADKAKFLQFVTGTSKVPLQGFANLEGMNGVQKFTIQKDTRSNSRLPSAHTCFNQLDLPEYNDFETMKKMLLLACRECSEGFAFA